MSSVTEIAGLKTEYRTDHCTWITCCVTSYVLGVFCLFSPYTWTSLISAFLCDGYMCVPVLNLGIITYCLHPRPRQSLLEKTDLPAEKIMLVARRKVGALALEC